MKEEITYVKGICRPIIFTRWWLRTRKIKSGPEFNEYGLKHAVHELYVPWWSWPFELLHRLVFGRAKLGDIHENQRN